MITNVDPDAGEIVALVYSPRSRRRLANRPPAVGMFPGSTLGRRCSRSRAATATPTSYPPERFHAQFAADMPEERTSAWRSRSGRSRRRRSRAVGRAAAVEGLRRGSFRRGGPQHPAALQHYLAERAGHRTIESRARPTRSPSRTPPRPPARSWTRPTRTSPRDAEAMSRSSRRGLLFERSHNGWNRSHMPTRVTPRERTTH